MLLSVGSNSRLYPLIDGSRASRRERILKAGAGSRAARRASPRLGPVTLFLIAGMTAAGLGVAAAVADPLGTASSTVAGCASGGVPGTCYEVKVSCPLEGINDQPVTIKGKEPAVAPVGTDILTNGRRRNGYYDQRFAYGQEVVRQVLQAGFATVQTDFSGGQVGWLTGPGGPRKLACRYATLAQWVYDNIHEGGAARPFCATGNSGGAGAIAYALAHYDLGSTLAMVEPTSGPPFGRVDYGCVCSPARRRSVNCSSLPSISECYGLFTAERFIDPSYDGDVDPPFFIDASDICGMDILTHSSAHADLFQQDSVASPDALFSYPQTDVHVVFGGLDASAAVPQGLEWVDLITSRKSVECVADAPHRIPDVVDGAMKIASDVITYCRLQPSQPEDPEFHKDLVGLQ